MADEGQRVIADAREACPTCPHFGVCPMASLFVQTAARGGARSRHPHSEVLQRYLKRLKKVTPRVERALLEAMGGKDEGRALVAGCLISEACWDEPERLARLLEGLAAKGPADRTLTDFEEHVIRAATFLQDPAIPPLLRGRHALRRGDREVTVYEAVRLVSRLVGGEMCDAWAEDAVREEDRRSFEASFILREKGLPGDSSHGSGALDLFFSARSGGRSSVFYYRRDTEGKQALVSVEGIRPDSLLTRLFKVFHSDRLKTHRLFAKVARFLNNGFKGLDKRMLWEGLKRLTQEQQIVLALYAPRLGKYIEKRASFPGLYRLSKFLHRNVTEKREGEPAHRKIFAQRAMVHDIVELYGKETFKKFCRWVFGIAEATPEGPEWSDLIFQIGEVAYFVTAIEGFNPAGLELSLRGRNPLAFVAYGLQPPGKNPKRRLLALRTVKERVEKEPDEKKRAELVEAVDAGLLYLAQIHGYEDPGAMERALEGAPASSG